MGIRKPCYFYLGFSAVFFTVMILISLISSAIIQVIPQFLFYLKLIGGSYILWLAYSVVVKGFQIEQKPQPSLNFSSGFILQFLNPKVAFFGLTIFTSFLNPLNGNLPLLLTAAILLAVWIWVVNSAWAGAGSIVLNTFKNPQIMRTFSLVIAVLLVYAALNIFGFFEFLRTLG